MSYPDFLVPPQIATTIKDVGYDTCSTASNHTLDHGVSGCVARWTPSTGPGSSTPVRRAARRRRVLR
ncbi:CapA family protein [Streptomyces sp. M10(2022)]